MKRYLLAMLVLVGTTLAFTSSASAQAPPTPVAATQTSVPGHPLRVLFGSTPAAEQSLAGPNLDGLPSYADFDSVRRLVGGVLPSALAGFVLDSVQGSGRTGLFAASARFHGSAGTTTVRVSAWTKTGDFLIAVPANSPVTEVTQTTIDGLYALTLLPTSAVVGGIGPRTVYLTDGRTIWSLEIEGFTDNAAALKLVETVVQIVTTPGAPATGTSLNADASDSSFAALSILFGATLVIVSGATLLRIRQH